MPGPQEIPFTAEEIGIEVPLTMFGTCSVQATFERFSMLLWKLESAGVINVCYKMANSRQQRYLSS